MPKPRLEEVLHFLVVAFPCVVRRKCADGLYRLGGYQVAGDLLLELVYDGRRGDRGSIRDTCTIGYTERD